MVLLRFKFKMQLTCNSEILESKIEIRYRKKMCARKVRLHMRRSIHIEHACMRVCLQTATFLRIPVKTEWYV